MIVISTYNPNVPRQTDDEELLTTMLHSLVLFRNRSVSAKNSSVEQIDQVHHQEQIKNCDRLIGLVYPLLGMELTEIMGILQDWGGK